MNERRKAERHQLLFNARVYAADTGRELGHLANIGEDGGLMVMGEAALDVGRAHRVRIPLPGEWNGLDALVLDTTVAWTLPALHPGMHRNGLEPRAIDRQQRDALVELANAFALTFEE